MRSVAAAVAAVLSAVLLAGCGSGPNQVGAAAIVGGHEITIQSTQAWWNRLTADPAAKEKLRAMGELNGLGRSIVTEQVRTELLRQVAQREGMQFDEAQVSELIKSFGGEQAAVEASGSRLYDSTTIRDRARYELMAAALGRKYFDTTIMFDAMIVDKRDTALDKARELAASGGRAHEIVAAAAKENPQTATVDQRQSIADSVAFAVASPLFSVPAGNVVAFPIANTGGPAGDPRWFVFVLRERNTGTPSAFPDAPTVDKVDQSQLWPIGQRVLSILARDIGVRLNPRYGVWSSAELTAFANEDDATSTSVVVPMATPVKS